MTRCRRCSGRAPTRHGEWLTATDELADLRADCERMASPASRTS